MDGIVEAELLVHARDLLGIDDRAAVGHLSRGEIAGNDAEHHEDQPGDRKQDRNGLQQATDDIGQHGKLLIAAAGRTQVKARKSPSPRTGSVAAGPGYGCHRAGENLR